MENLKLNLYGKVYNLSTEKLTYKLNDALAIRLLVNDLEPFCMLTTNIMDSNFCRENCAYIDTYGCPWAEDFIKEYELGYPTGNIGVKGFCHYPEYEFDLSKL